MAETQSTTLFSLTTLKTWMNVPNLKSEDDEKLAIAADAATDEIEQETARAFVTRSITDTFNGRGQTGLTLSRGPVISITSVTVDGTVKAASDYLVDLKLGTIDLANYARFTTGQRNIIVVFQAGYDRQDGPLLPRDVYRAALDLTKAIYDELKLGAISVSSINMGPTSTIIKTSKRPLSVQRVIDNWRSVRVV
jgi:hypothetical protein